MSSMVMLVSLIQAIEKDLRAFLWGHQAKHRGLHLPLWKAICKSKENGGLGLHSLRTKQQAILCKFINIGVCVDADDSMAVLLSSLPLEFDVLVKMFHINASMSFEDLVEPS